MRAAALLRWCTAVLPRTVQGTCPEVSQCTRGEGVRAAALAIDHRSGLIASSGYSDMQHRVALLATLINIAGCFVRPTRRLQPSQQRSSSAPDDESESDEIDFDFEAAYRKRSSIALMQPLKNSEA